MPRARITGRRNGGGVRFGVGRNGRAFMQVLRSNEAAVNQEGGSLGGRGDRVLHKPNPALERIDNGGASRWFCKHGWRRCGPLRCTFWALPFVHRLADFSWRLLAAMWRANAGVGCPSLGHRSMSDVRAGSVRRLHHGNQDEIS